MIKTVFTLGPENTNCEKAARKWIRDKEIKADIILCDTLEEGIEKLKQNKLESVLLSCIVYPDLHTLVFNNLEEVKLVDCFIMNTHPMVFASNKMEDDIQNVASHPAPYLLAPKDLNKIYVDSNVKAAMSCYKGDTDSCVTTKVAADTLNLNIVKNYGEVPMGFAIHCSNDLKIK